ncbi:MAG: hypothetical protein AAGD07_14095 [Planctomycetota bacterium]
MRTQAQPRQFSERTLRQVKLDSSRALAREQFCLESSEITHFRCVDDHPESDLRFGNQLWYFEAVGVDETGRRMPVFGVVEYSLQYGLSELVEDAIFDTAGERERFRAHYERTMQGPSWHQPAHRILLGLMVGVALVSLLLFLLRSLYVTAASGW